MNSSLVHRLAKLFIWFARVYMIIYVKCFTINFFPFSSIHKHKFQVIPSSLSIDVLPFKWLKRKSMCHIILVQYHACSARKLHPFISMHEKLITLTCWFFRHTDAVSRPCEGSAHRLLGGGEWGRPCQFPSFVAAHPWGPGVPSAWGLQHDQSLLPPPQPHPSPLRLSHRSQVWQPKGLRQGELRDSF